MPSTWAALFYRIPTFTVGRHSKKIIQRVLKINASTKSLVERLCDLKVYAVSVLSYTGSICAPDKAALKAEAQCPSVYHCTLLFPPACWALVPCVALVLTWLVSMLSASRPAIELQIQAAREFDFGNILALCPNWEKDFLAPSIARSILEAFNIVCRLDRKGKVDEVSQDKKQKVATSLLRDKQHTQDFAGPMSLRASKVLGPISRYRRVPLVLVFLLVFCASFATGYVRLKDFTLKERDKRVELDVRMMNQTHHNSLQRVSSPVQCLPLFGDRLRRFHGEAIFSMT